MEDAVIVGTIWNPYFIIKILSTYLSEKQVFPVCAETQ